MANGKATADEILARAAATLADGRRAYRLRPRRRRYSGFRVETFAAAFVALAAALKVLREAVRVP